MAARRAVNPSRRLADSGSVPLVSSLHQKSRTSPLLSIGLVLVGAFLLIGYSYRGSGGFVSDKEAISRDGGGSCTSEVLQAIPILKKAYGDNMRKVLHVGPDTCKVVSKLLKEDNVEAWGVEPYDLEDVDTSCKTLVRKGFVRLADIKFPLPYRPKSFSLVIVSDALDYLSPKYLNKTLPDLARVSSDGLVIFAGYPGQQRAKVSELSKFGRPAKLRSSSWWIRYFVQIGLEENESVIKKFEPAASKRSYKGSCQIFHLSS
ncbi:probable pectin methylesterase CGR2 [Phoenix dactylifera]|uniref:Probable pectin methylesterase CGR2 n=1 Tax=Phoenix dactylifera TaxID=42345 RepID=A0A8B7BUA5_PHODC|nr:probable pectin methylesterase CGR2 [Phoenix dactylifera]XP_008785529.1 probable pectin methylesterase CGR2 [Phoenix dactylifera]